ncbi:MAG: hypothetical protein WC419_01190 [Candidatus Omnitrophota bacterium]|jgi:hypothetical protein
MKIKKIIVGIVVLIVFAGLIIFVKAIASKARSGKAAAPAVQLKKGMKKPAAQKVISKGKGALTVRIVNSKNVGIPMRIKAFRVIDGRSSIYTASFVGGRMQEVVPGTYDLEVDSVPQKIFKNIKVAEGKETVEDLGCVMGSITVKALNAKKAAAYYPMRVLYSNTNDMVTAYMTNKTMEIVPGVYDIEIGTSPRLYKKNIKIVSGKETILNLGCVVGSLMVKTVNENGNNVRLSVRITRADTNEVISSAVSNKPVDLGKGTYNIEVLSSPRQHKKGVSVNLGEESVVDFVINTPVPSKKSAKSAVRIKQQ